MGRVCLNDAQTRVCVRHDARVTTARLTNRLHISLSHLTDDQLLAIQQAFTYDNPAYHKLKAMGRRFIPKGVPRYLSSWTATKGTLSIPRGGEAKLNKLLGDLTVLDETTNGDPALAGQLPQHLLKLRPYQEELKAICLKRELALIRSSPGSGKTTIGFALASDINLPTLVVVPTEKIFTQWVKGAKRQLGLDEDEVGIIQGSTRRIRPLTIGMQQTLANCADTYAHTFGVVIGDESQKFAATTFFKVIDKMQARYRIGMSADERRADGKEFLIYDVFGNVVGEVERNRLITEGAIIDAEVRIIPTDFRADWYTRLTGNKRANSEVQQRLADEIANNRARNEIVLETLGHCVDEGESTITLTWRREHCAILNSLSIARGWDSGLLLGGTDSKADFDRTERELREGVLRQAVGTYQAVGVGFDLPRVSRGIFAGPCAGNSGQQQFIQYCGRFERPDPDTGKVAPDAAVVYYLWDQHVHPLTHVSNIAKWKPKTTILIDGEWVPAKEWAKAQRARHNAKHDDEEEVSGFISA